MGVKDVKGAFKLPIQTVTIVPSTKDKSKGISKAEFTRRVTETRRFLSTTFGGFTSVKAVGGYTLKDKVIKEDVVLVNAYADTETFKKKKQAWISWVRKKGKMWGQDSMGIIIENDLMYI